VRWNRIVLVGALLLALASTVGCSQIADRMLQRAMEAPGTVHVAAGRTITTKSGLTLTVPPGASATIAPGQDPGFVQFVDVELPARKGSVSFVSLAADSHNQLNPGRFRVIGSSDQSRTVVMETSATSLPITVETNVAGALPGRVVVFAPRESTTEERGLSLARLIWSELKVAGATIP
jgi:hypothetical protein